ncbi:MAG TPA: GTPase HflX, partial [Savagea sp.]
KADATSMPYPYVQDNEIWMSAKEGKGLEQLLQLMNRYIFADYEIETVTVPYDRGDLVSLLNEEAHVIETEYEEDGTQLTIEWSSRLKEQFQQALQNA